MIRIGFGVEFLLDHLREIVRALFLRKIQLTEDAIDTRIENLKKEVVDLEARHECLLFDVTTLAASWTRPLFQAFNHLDVYLL